MPQYDPNTGLTSTARRYAFPSYSPVYYGNQARAAINRTAQPGVTGGVGDQTQGPPQFSYSQILGSDPLYQQTLADLGAQNVADRSGLKTARQRAIVQFGEVPDFAALDQSVLGEGFSEDIDPVTRELASKNTQEGLSVAARINKQHNENVRALTNYLSSRGLLRSGEAGYRLGEEEQGYKTAQYDSRQKLLDYLSQYQSGYLQGLAQRRAAQQQAAGGAYNTAIGLYGNTPIGPSYTPAPPIPNQPQAPPPVVRAVGESPYYGEYAQPTNRGLWRAL